MYVSIGPRGGTVRSALDYRCVVAGVCGNHAVVAIRVIVRTASRFPAMAHAGRYLTTGNSYEHREVLQ